MMHLKTTQWKIDEISYPLLIWCKVSEWCVENGLGLHNPYIKSYSDSPVKAIWQNA
jgi:hypothetical protein